MGSVNELNYVLQKNTLEVLNHQPGRMFLFGRNDAEAPILWPPDAKSQLIRKDPDAGKD